jgi:hypothetical protein
MPLDFATRRRLGPRWIDRNARAVPNTDAEVPRPARTRRRLGHHDGVRSGQETNAIEQIKHCGTRIDVMD